MLVYTKMLFLLKKQIFGSFWSAQHPRAGQNIQQKLVLKAEYNSIDFIPLLVKLAVIKYQPNLSRSYH